jgi:hypothetical protein
MSGRVRQSFNALDEFPVCRCRFWQLIACSAMSSWRSILRPALRWIERAAWLVGLAGLTIWAASDIIRREGSARELQRFQAARETAVARPIHVGAPDTGLWDPKRILAWQESQKDPSAPPLAVIRIARIGIEAPVLEGTSDWTLNRGVGHIEDTASPGADGNVGIAGHRDGFFRALKDVDAGDLLEVETLAGVVQYRVERWWMDRGAGRRVRARSHAGAVGDPRDVLPVLLRRFRTAPIHRSRGAHGRAVGSRGAQLRGLAIGKEAVL